MPGCPLGKLVDVDKLNALRRVKLKLTLSSSSWQEMYVT
jgi:hypothetical protein